MENHNGFTLIELIVTLAIAAILLTLAVPSFTTAIQNNRLTTQANDFVGDIALARSEAIKRGGRVTICKSANGSACTAAGGWEQGWLIFTDPDATATITPGDTLLRTHEALSGNGNTLDGNANVSNYISYNSRGETALITGAIQAGSLALCDSRGFNNGRAIIVSATGRVRAVRTTDASVTITTCTP